MAMTTDGATAGDALTAETLAAMEAAHAEYVAARAAHAALAERGDDARHARDLSRDRIARAAAETAANVPRLLAEVARQREEIARLTVALDGVRREERERVIDDCADALRPSHVVDPALALMRCRDAIYGLRGGR